MDYGRPIEFGLSIVPEAANLRAIVDAVTVADDVRFDLIGVQDHPYQRRFVDTMTLIGRLLASTTRVRIFPDVASLPMRSPAMLAKEAASLDVLSEGRFELGLGAGFFWDAIAAMGGARRTQREAVDALAEAIAIIRQAWSDEPSVRYRGRYYVVDGYRPGPSPAHPIEIWVGGYKRRMLRLTGQLGDGWIPSLGRMTLEELAAGQKMIDSAAGDAGRKPSAIRRMVNIGASLTDAGATTGGETTEGETADAWVERLVELATGYGIDTFILWLSDPRREQIEGFAHDVFPRVRAEVNRRRISAGFSSRTDSCGTDPSAGA
jgi:alkanesulfonate monooxygenase SsuD/methylene tetrahydromethanopterin reductase-like flavin-dependent oxidoreductase (luciferase family)